MQKRSYGTDLKTKQSNSSSIGKLLQKYHREAREKIKEEY